MWVKRFYFLVIFLSNWALAQAPYYSKKNKDVGLIYFQDQIYQSCQSPKTRQDPVSKEEMKKLADEIKRIVGENFSRAFKENPSIKENFEKDLGKLSQKPMCRAPGNHCRARLIALSLFYYQRLRADIPDCQAYEKKDEKDPFYNAECEMELKFRKSDFEKVRGSSEYEKELIAIKNNVTMQLFNVVMRKTKDELYICNSERGASSYHFNLDIKTPGEFMEGVVPYAAALPVLPCKEEKKVLWEGFIPIDFDEGRNTVGFDQVEPVKAAILNFVRSNGSAVITDVRVISSTSQSPSYITLGGKRTLDPKSKERNLSLAKERVSFVKKSWEEIATRSELLTAKFDASAVVAGPDFSPRDLNDRFVTHMTPGYVQRIEAVYDKFRDQYQSVALKQGYEDLLDEKQFVNVFQAKFKPFLGFKLTIMGQRKEDLKCSPLTVPEKKSKASRQ